MVMVSVEFIHVSMYMGVLSGLRNNKKLCADTALKERVSASPGS